MIFTGQFKSLHKDTLYTVNIDCSTGGNHTFPIRLGPEPFVTSMDGGASTIYVPVKYQSATVQIVANNSQSSFLNLYSSTPKQNKVELKKGNTVVWSGYTSPNIYDTPYNFETETWNVEAIDRLSVLKYYDYTPLDGSLGFVSFTRIINACLLQAGYDSSCHWHFSNATHVYDNDTSTNKSFLTDQLYISEANFFDEDETPMKMNEVLEEICKYCGVTCVGYGDDVYFLDYDALMLSAVTYRKYYDHTVGVDSSVITATSDCNDCSTYTISADSYAETGTNLSLDNVYSKVTVKDSLYTVDSIIPSMFEDEDLQNVAYINEKNQMWNYDFTQYCMDQGKKEGWEDTDDDTYFVIKSRYYTNKRFEHFNYMNSGASLVGNVIDSSVLDATRHLGILFSRFNISTGKMMYEANNNLQYDNFTNYLMIPVNHTYLYKKKKLVTKAEFTKPFFLSGKTKLIAKGSMILTDRDYFNSVKFLQGPGQWEVHADTSVGYFPQTGILEGDFDYWYFLGFDGGRRAMIQQKYLTLDVSININGVDTDVNIPFYQLNEGNTVLYEDGGRDPHHEIFYQNFDVQNSVSYDDNISDKGYIIPTSMDASTVVPAKPIITFWGVDKLSKRFQESYNVNPVACVFIKDFDIQAVVGYQGGKDENDTNTEYSYVINDQYVQELGAIEFKICSYDDKQLTYSAPAWKDPSTGKFKFVNLLRSRPLGHTERSEHLMCYRIVNQYNTPSKKVSINLFLDNIRPWTKLKFSPLTTGSVMDDAWFIVDTVSFDYVNDTARCELVEKK